VPGAAFIPRNFKVYPLHTASNSIHHPLEYYVSGASSNGAYFVINTAGILKQNQKKWRGSQIHTIS